jgi:hypothetical protein
MATYYLFRVPKRRGGRTIICIITQMLYRNSICSYPHPSFIYTCESLGMGMLLRTQVHASVTTHLYRVPPRDSLNTEPDVTCRIAKHREKTLGHGTLAHRFSNS